jgi:hypothetical protein
VQVVVVVNSSTNEILEIRNTGGAPLDIGRWWLDGSKGEDSCVIPAGTVLAPGAGYQVATGDSEPQGAGVKCGDKPIWNNGGEVVYLHGVDGECGDRGRGGTAVRVKKRSSIAFAKSQCRKPTID